MSAVPAGTYDVEVRVDDYVAGTLRGVQVTEDQTGVDIEIRPPVFTLAPPWPNPARTTVTLAFELIRAGAAKLSVHDAAGRVVRAWQSDNAAPGRRVVSWDFRDRQGHEVPAGVYFVRLVTEDGTAVRRLLRLP